MNRHLATLSGVFLVMLVASACATRTAPSLASSMPAADPADFEMQLNEYVEVQEALAADDFDEARAQLEEFARITDSATQALAARALEAPDIATLRVDFKPLSESLVAHDLPQGFARAYCPMYDNGASWVQRDGPVRNPYYGSTMLTCGVVDAAAGAHMDHTAQHGGTVFMAPDGFHHIEGVYPEPGVFRIYATDNYRAEVDVTGWTGRAVTEEDYDAVMGLNVRAAIFAAKAVTASMIKSGKGGSVINMSSQMGHVGAANRTLYCASKWALEGFTKALAVELGSMGIRVNTICPTFIETPMTRPFLDDPQFREQILSKIKLGRLGTVDDVVGAAVFLASESSSLMTGSSLMLDGGWTAD